MSLSLAATYSRVEDVDGLDSRFAFLLEPEHQVDPLTQRLGDLLGLQCLSVDQDEQTWVVSSPGWQIHMIHPLAILTNPKIKTCTAKLKEKMKIYAGFNSSYKRVK